MDFVKNKDRESNIANITTAFVLPVRLTILLTCIREFGNGI
jgi:hypothetical protein